jgi:nicotinate-nucleotide adenylyltransferase
MLAADKLNVNLVAQVIGMISINIAGNSSERGRRRVAVFPGAFNPPTVAHLEMARSALAYADEVLWVLPRAFPHKSFDGANFNDRCRMLERVTGAEAGFSAGVSDGGLYAEIAAEAAAFYGPETEIALVCGRDAAERIASWDYGRAGVFDELVRRHPLLVAARAGEYVAPSLHAGRIIAIPLAPTAEGVSSSEVRRLIASGLPWEHLVPPVIVDLVRQSYDID